MACYPVEEKLVHNRKDSYNMKRSDRWTLLIWGESISASYGTDKLTYLRWNCGNGERIFLSGKAQSGA